MDAQRYCSLCQSDISASWVPITTTILPASNKLLVFKIYEYLGLELFDAEDHICEVCCDLIKNHDHLRVMAEKSLEEIKGRIISLDMDYSGWDVAAAAPSGGGGVKLEPDAGEGANEPEAATMIESFFTGDGQFIDETCWVSEDEDGTNGSERKAQKWRKASDRPVEIDVDDMVEQVIEKVTSEESGGPCALMRLQSRVDDLSVTEKSTVYKVFIYAMSGYLKSKGLKGHMAFPVSTDIYSLRSRLLKMYPSWAMLVTPNGKRSEVKDPMQDDFYGKLLNKLTYGMKKALDDRYLKARRDARMLAKLCRDTSHAGVSSNMLYGQGATPSIKQEVTQQDQDDFGDDPDFNQDDWEPEDDGAKRRKSRQKGAYQHRRPYNRPVSIDMNDMVMVSIQKVTNEHSSGPCPYYRLLSRTEDLEPEDKRFVSKGFVYAMHGYLKSKGLSGDMALPMVEELLELRKELFKRFPAWANVKTPGGLKRAQTQSREPCRDVLFGYLEAALRTVLRNKGKRTESEMF